MQQLQLFPQNFFSPQTGRLHYLSEEAGAHPDEEMGRSKSVDLTPIQRTVSAAGLSAPRTTAARSVFDLGAAGCRVDMRGDEETPPTATAIRVPRCVVHSLHEGRKVYAGVNYPAKRITEEDEERERQRRARQKPPRPPRQKFKMRNSRAWADEQGT